MAESPGTDYPEADSAARFWHRRYDEQHCTLHHAEDEIARLREVIADLTELRKAVRGLLNADASQPLGDVTGALIHLAAVMARLGLKDAGLLDADPAGQEQQ